MYFTTDTDSLHHNGKEVGVIKNGDLQTTVNEKLAAEIEKLKVQVQAPTTTKVPTTDDIVNTTGFGVSNEFDLTDKTITIKVTPSADGVNFFYDANLANLGGENIYTKVLVESNNNTLLNTDKLSTSFNLSPANFPAFISFDIRRNINNVTELYSAKAQLNQTSDVQISLYKKRFGDTEIRTQTEVNNYVYNKLGEVQKNVTTKINYGGEEISLQETVNRLLIEISDLKKVTDVSNNKITYTVGAAGKATKTISEALSEITAQLNA